VRVLETIGELRLVLGEARAAGLSVGFVPTMGYLHAGHVSLMEASVSDNDVTVVSIFVNPLQFAPSEDLGTYPVDPTGDLAACREAGVDHVFVPSAEQMYPSAMSTSVSVGEVSAPLEGEFRPTHFSGVATVVAKLFSIIGPCRAYFGAKDWQQVAVVRRMAADLSFPVDVIDRPIVRDPDGLALSSRNVHLSTEQRSQAGVLQRSLLIGAQLVAAGETDPSVVEAAMKEAISRAPLADLDYAAAVRPDTLTSDGPLHGEVRLLVAVRFGRVRLIDNVGCRTLEP